MTIEPSSVRFTIGTKTIPPKPAPRILSPKLSMAEDARQCNARLRWEVGFYCPQASGQESNNASHAEAVARKEALAQRFLALLSQGPMPSSALEAATQTSENLTAGALRLLRKRGLVTFTRKTGPCLWSITEGIA